MSSKARTPERVNSSGQGWGGGVPPFQTRHDRGLARKTSGAPQKEVAGAAWPALGHLRYLQESPFKDQATCSATLSG